MTDVLPHHRVYAIRYAQHQRLAAENFVYPPPEPQAAMPMDYFVWLVALADGRHVLVDTGFRLEAGRERGRTLLRPVAGGLRKLGADPDTLGDVAITHLHYDHAGNVEAFPNARFWLQERELSYASGRYMCDRFFNLAYDRADVMRMVSLAFDGRVAFVDGDHELAPGVTLHRVGGHTAGLQIVRVHTESGWVVVASDLFHYYANLERRSPFPIVYRPGEMFDGFATARRLASSEQLLVPGHDPDVMTRFAAEPADPEFTVQLWRPASVR